MPRLLAARQAAVVAAATALLTAPVAVAATSDDAAPAAAAVTSSTAPAASAAGTPPLVGDLWARTELYFGTERPDGSEVTDKQFARFVDEVITPRFPDGLTHLSGAGQFRGSDDVIVEERSHLVVLLNPLDAPGRNRKIEEIRDRYEKKFEQQSVLRVEAAERVSF